MNNTIVILIVIGILSLGGLLMGYLNDGKASIIPLITLGLSLLSILAICIHIDINKPTKSTDYQIICGNDTLILMDSSVIVKKIPYSDTSDIWKVIINDNR